MLRLGVQAALPEHLLRHLPAGVEVVRIPAVTDDVFDIDMWVVPFGKGPATAMWPHLRGVKVAQAVMAGVDWVLPWLPKDVMLCDGRGIHDISTSEWVLSVILATYKRLPLYRDRQHKHEWRGIAQEAVFTDDDAASNGLYRILSEDLHGKRALIVGYGSIGSAIERRLQAFGVEVERIARSPKHEPYVHGIAELPKLLPHADIVVLIVPLTDATRGLIGANEIALMKRGALLVNAARGPVVQTDALIKALHNGHIRAAVDVTDPEPLPEDHPLWSAPNLLITPHVAGSTPEFIERAFQFVGKQAERYLAGQPLENVVNEHGY